jgi:D-glycero-alpha-D-manno-heptose-7-phosphate kinase
MIISRTPFRVSLFGGGTDYPGWYREHGGAVLASSIDKYCYISVRDLPPFFAHKFRIVYSTVETVNEVAHIGHPAVRAVLERFGTTQGLEIHHGGDLPARSGIGSSSAFTVGLIAAMKALHGDAASKEFLAREAIHIEQCVLREPVGVQDQITSAFGGFNHIAFHQDGAFDVQPMRLTRERVNALQSHLLLLFTGIVRTSADVTQAIASSLRTRAAEFCGLQQTVVAAHDVLLSPRADLLDIGRLLHDSWILKRRLSDCVSNPIVNDIYDTARRAGAIGGKLLGAGGGGFMLLFVQPEDRPRVCRALNGLIPVPFAFEHQGARIVVNQTAGREQPAT